MASVTERVCEQRSLHFSLPFFPADRVATLHVGHERHPLQHHDEHTLKAARTTNRALRLLPDALVTHFTPDLQLPAHSAQLLLVTTPSALPKARLPTLLLSKIHVPKAALRAAVAEGWVAGVPSPALVFAGVPDDGTDPDLPPDVDDWTSAMDAAVQSVFQHSELLNIGGPIAAIVKQAITYSNGISDLAMQILTQAQAHTGDPSQPNWVEEVSYSLPDGSPASGRSRYVWSTTTQTWMAGPMKDSLRKTKNLPALQSTSTVAGCYSVQSGVTALNSAQNGAAPRMTGGHLAADSPQPSDDGSYWTVTNHTPQNGFGYNNDLSMTGGTFSASFTNWWLRWLSGYVEFLGPDGNPVVPQGWTTQVPGGLAGTYDSDTKKYVALFSSVSTILAIPIGSSPTTITFPWPKNASGVRILAGGIGRTGGIQGEDGIYYGGWDAQVCAAGAIMTGIFCFGIPTVCLVMGAVIPQTALSDLAKSLIGTALDLGSALINGPIAGALSGGNLTSALLAFADAIPHLLLDTPDLVLAIDAAVAEEAVEEATPIFGWIALGVSVAATVAALVETSVEVALSPAVFDLSMMRAVDAEWTLSPDPGHKMWPREATHYIVTAKFQDGTPRQTTGELGPPPLTSPITVQFNSANKNQLPGGGTVTFTACFYSDTGWMCGSATSQPIPVPIDSNLLTVPPQAIVEKVIPIDADTRYLYQQSLTYDASASRRAWAAARPSATVKSLNPSNIGNNIGALRQITVNGPAGQVAYGWQASGQDIPLNGGNAPSEVQMDAFQTLSFLTPQESGLRFVPSGFGAPALVLYDLEGAAGGNHFYLDPDQEAFHLRRVALDGSSGTFPPPGGVSWGRFNQRLDACVVHSSGYVVGVNTQNAKIEVLRLPTASVPDAQAPLADIRSGYGARPGLLHQPVGIAPSVGAGVIVLENTDDSLGAPARLQGFDLLGNPAPMFAGNSPTALLHTESGPVTCLAVATETKGYIYVLKYIGDGSIPSDYLLDLYNPDGSFLSQTVGLPAGSLAVDLWRTVYTLDYAQITKPSGGRTEPSVSIWTPTTPS